MKKPKLLNKNKIHNDISAEITGTTPNKEVIKVTAWDGSIDITLDEAIMLKKFFDEAIPYIQSKQKLK